MYKYIYIYNAIPLVSGTFPISKWHFWVSGRIKSVDTAATDLKDAVAICLVLLKR